MEKLYYHGNVAGSDVEKSGWFIGQFVAESHGLRKTDQVEMKWDAVPAGKSRPKWGVNDVATSMTLLIRGKFRVKFKEGEVLLSKEGDYVVWGPGQAHLWSAEADSVTLTIRWPSSPQSFRDQDAP